MVTIAVLASTGHTLDSFFPPLASAWTKAGHRVEMASSTYSVVHPHTVIESLSRRPSFRNVFARREIESWLTTVGADVLITNTAVSSFLARGRRMPCPVIYFCHGLHWNTGRKLSERAWQFLEKVALKHTDGVLSMNDDDEAWFVENAPEVRQLRLSSGVGLDLNEYPFKPRVMAPTGPKVIWIGELNSRKRPKLAIDAFADLLYEIPTAHLAMCGRGPGLATIEAMVLARGLGDKVDLLGFRDDIPRLLMDSDVLLITSEWEGLPRVGLEALAVGRPVVGYDVKGVRSLPGVLLADEGDAAGLRRLLVQALGAHADLAFVDRESLSASRVAADIADFVIEIVDESEMNGSDHRRVKQLDEDCDS